VSDKRKRLLYIQFTNPAGYPPLQHSSRILADAGWQILLLGTGAHGSAALQFPRHQNVSVKQMRFCPAGWRQKVHYLRYTFWALCWSIIWRPKWVYASDALSAPIALAISVLARKPIIYHEHDTPEKHSGPQGDAEPGASRFQRLMLWSRKRIAVRARVCILPNQERAIAFSNEMNRGESVYCVCNCPSRAEAHPQPSQVSRDCFVLWYHGSVVPSQLPESIIRALALLPTTVKLRVAGYETVGHGGYVKRLQSLACTLGVQDRFEYLGTLPGRNELLQQCAACDVGLALFVANTRQPMVGASNKPFDYLACGLALLTPDAADWRSLFVEPGYASSCDPASPENIASAIEWLANHRAETRAMGEAGRRRILQDWNYEAQFAPIEQLLGCSA
jgi:glycosyltransferase involved in cell wall biosynthesis